MSKRIALLLFASALIISLNVLLLQKTLKFLMAPLDRQANESGSRSSSTLFFHGETTAEVQEDMSPADADNAYYTFVTHIHYTCNDSVRLGATADGGWNACLIPPFELVKPCLVYSFGINWDFSFDDAVSKNFGCTVRAFDPSMSSTSDHRRDANIWFYKIGLGGADTVTSGGWKIKKLESIINLLHDTGKIIDYLKIDIEDNEWDSLKTMIQSDILNRVKQFGVEVHTMPRMLTDTKAFHERYWTLKKLEELGFRRWYWHFNHFGEYWFNGRKRSCCYEMVYINTKFMLPLTTDVY